MAVPRIIYTLGCGHNAPGIATLVSGELFCPWHREMSPIADVVTLEWQVVCHTCIFARWAGLSQSSAEVLRVGHLRRNTGHRVMVGQNSNPEAVKTQQKLIKYRAHRS